MNTLLLRLAKLKFVIVEYKARRYPFRVIDKERNNHSVAQFEDRDSAEKYRGQLIDNFVKDYDESYPRTVLSVAETTASVS